MNEYVKLLLEVWYFARLICTVCSSALDTCSALLVQVNGKMRGTVEVGVSADQSAAVEAAMGLNSVKKFTDGKEIKKVIYVPGKILNLIVPGK